MNDRQLEKKVRQDAAKVKKDISTLVGDSTARMSRFGENVNQTAEDLTTRVGDGYEKLMADASETVVSAAADVNKNVGHSLSQYNAKAQQTADKLPGSLGKKIARYPWVAISITLAAGFLLGSLLKPARRFLR